MNNNQINFDPMTGQPINQTNNNFVSNIETINQNNNNIVPNNIAINTAPQNNIPNQPENINNNTLNQSVETTVVNPQQTMQSIPTVEQSKQDFINNTQANSTEKKDEKKDGPNFVFIIILFIIIFASIFFLFPYLQKTL